MNETIEKEMSLANAVLAINLSPLTSKLCNRDICFAVERQFSLPLSTFSVSSFHSDFIIHLSTPSDRDNVLKSDQLHGDKFNMILTPWSPTYKSETICWEARVAVDITNIPPHACFVHCLQPMLLPHCTIESAAFNTRKGACRITGFAFSVQSIPSHGYVGLQYPRPDGVSNELFTINLRAYPLSEAPRFKSDSSPPQSPGSPDTIGTAEQFGVDPDVVREMYEEQNRAERAALNQPASRRFCRHEDGYCSIDSSLGIPEDEEHGWESDRSGHW